jgi:hypothetical protein
MMSIMKQRTAGKRKYIEGAILFQAKRLSTLANIGCFLLHIKYYKVKIIVTLLLACFSGLAFAQEIPLPEHPRPDFERHDWLNLNGGWDFESARYCQA